MLHMSGVNTTKYTAGSVRAAAASQAKAKSVPLCHIMSKAGWSRESTFAKYYNKAIVQDNDSSRMQCWTIYRNLFAHTVSLYVEEIW